jgi:hypothetical protein
MAHHVTPCHIGSRRKAYTALGAEEVDLAVMTDGEAEHKPLEQHLERVLANAATARAEAALQPAGPL